MRKHQDWFDENNPEIQVLIGKMHHLHKLWITDKNSPSKKRAYKECKQHVQSSLRSMKETWWSKKPVELQDAADKQDLKAFYDGLKTVYGPRESRSSPVLSSDSKTLFTDKKEIVTRWKEHFENVLNMASTIDETVISSIPQRAEIPALFADLTLKEVKDAIKQLFCRKAPGEDGNPPEVFKYGGQKLVCKLPDLFRAIWRVGGVPQDFKDASIIHLFKNKGNKSVCDNSRGISLLCIAGKVLSCVILNRIISNLVDEIYPETQCGFRSVRGTIEMICLRQVAEKVREKNQELYMVFVDLTKAFDTVNRTCLWKVLKKTRHT